MPSFVEILPLSREIWWHPKEVLTGGQRTDRQPDRQIAVRTTRRHNASRRRRQNKLIEIVQHNTVRHYTAESVCDVGNFINLKKITLELNRANINNKPH